MRGYADAAITCVEIFLLPFSGKTIIIKLLKFAGYVHYNGSLSGNIFHLILEKTMSTTNIQS